MLCEGCHQEANVVEWVACLSGKWKVLGSIPGQYLPFLVRPPTTPTGWIPGGAPRAVVQGSVHLGVMSSSRPNKKKLTNKAPCRH